MQDKINKIKEKMTDNKEKNNKIVKKNKKILFNPNNFEYIIESLGDKTLLLIEAMYENGFSPNKKNGVGDNLILNYISLQIIEEKEIIKLIKLSLKYGLDVNILDKFGDTILHNLLGYKRYFGNIIPVYKLLRENGFNVLLLDNDFDSLEDVAGNNSNIYDIEEFVKIFNNDVEEEIIHNFYARYFNLWYSDCYKDRTDLFEELTHIQLHEKFVLKAIEELLIEGCDINTRYASSGKNYVMEFIKYKHSEEFIKKLIELGIKYNLNLNYKDDYNNTLLHNIIIRDTYTGNIIPLYNLLIGNGFDDTIKNDEGYTIYDLFFEEEDYGIDDRDQFLKIYHKKDLEGDFINNINVYNLNERDYEFIKKFNKNINNEWIERETDIDIEHNEINIILGTQGVGKSKYLVNLCSKKNARGEKSLIVSVDDILKNCSTVSEFYPLLFKLMRTCAENKIILMIDDIDKIYNEKIDDIKKEKINKTIDKYIKEYGLTLVGTVNNCNAYTFIDNKLLFYSINFEFLFEPKDKYLIEIINYIIDSKKDKIIFTTEKVKDLFIKLLVLISSYEYRNNKNISNVKVCEDIINNLYNLCVKDNKFIDIDYIMCSINLSKYIDEKIIKIFIDELLLYSGLDNDLITDNIKKLIKKRNEESL